ncbi:unnamed protein product [Plutella xylostella]|uniref:(diamondback moth) hypothetical protein n=1 Tax=Plutella xylostella TaxID=51655 RepID=A0A8S4EQV1_PLUXY|nr:unnamed protein product [Plutella xylostella]
MLKTRTMRLLHKWSQEKWPCIALQTENLKKTFKCPSGELRCPTPQAHGNLWKTTPHQIMSPLLGLGSPSNERGVLCLVHHAGLELSWGEGWGGPPASPTRRHCFCDTFMIDSLVMGHERTMIGGVSNFVSNIAASSQRTHSIHKYITFWCFGEQGAEQVERARDGRAPVQIQETNASIQSSIAFLTAQNEDFKKKIDQLELKAKEDRKQISILEDKIESMQKGNRKANFEIKNVPKKPNETKEDLIKIVTCLSTSVAANVTPADVMDIYRVRGKQEGVLTTPVVVEMSSTILKTDLLKKCKLFNTMNKSKLRAKHLGFVTSEETAVFISEQLTPKSSRLYFLARDLIKSTEFKFCWTSLKSKLAPPASRESVRNLNTTATRLHANHGADIQIENSVRGLVTTHRRRQPIARQASMFGGFFSPASSARHRFLTHSAARRPGVRIVYSATKMDCVV